MRIAILCGNYYPNFSAVGLCASRLAETYAMTNDVSVLSVTDSINQDEFIVHNGVKVYKCVPKFERKRQKSINNKHYFTFMKKTVSNYYRFRRMIGLVCAKYSIRKDYVEAFKELIHKVSDVDLIIALCMPIESIYSAVQYREENDKHYKIVMMMYDGFADARTTHYYAWNKRLKFKRHIELEKYIFSACTKVCFVEQNKEHLIKHHASFQDRFVEVEHPSILEREKTDANDSYFSNSFVNFVYGGGLKKDYIDPTYFIKLISKIKNAKLHIFTSDNALQQFQDLNTSMNVCMKGWLKQEELNKVLYDADFLVNFATKDGHQISSKIFEYISMGRPFVHVYSSNTDNNLRYLKKYPLVLCLNENDEDEKNIKRLIDWCDANQGKSITFNEIKTSYYDCTPEYICKQIIEGIEL